jgi:hypothetical protein
VWFQSFSSLLRGEDWKLTHLRFLLFSVLKSLLPQHVGLCDDNFNVVLAVQTPASYFSSGFWSAHLWCLELWVSTPDYKSKGNRVLCSRMDENCWNAHKLSRGFVLTPKLLIQRSKTWLTWRKRWGWVGELCNGEEKTAINIVWYISEEETKEKSPMLELSCIYQDCCCVLLAISHFPIKVNFLLSEIGNLLLPSTVGSSFSIGIQPILTQEGRWRYQRPLIFEGTNVMCWFTMARSVLIYNFRMDLYSEECNWPFPPATHKEVECTPHECGL